MSVKISRVIIIIASSLWKPKRLYRFLVTTLVPAFFLWLSETILLIYNGRLHHSIHTLIVWLLLSSFNRSWLALHFHNICLILIFNGISTRFASFTLRKNVGVWHRLTSFIQKRTRGLHRCHPLLILDFVDFLYHALQHFLLLFCSNLPVLQISISLTVKFINSHHFSNDFTLFFSGYSYCLLFLSNFSVVSVLSFALFEIFSPVYLISINIIFWNFTVEIFVLSSLFFLNFLTNRFGINQT